MSTSILVMVSVLTAVEVLFILSSSEHALKAFLGYKLYVDLIYGVGLTLYMGLSGTISGVIIAAFSGFFMTLTLLLASKIIGYRKRKVLDDGKVVWVEYPPTLTVLSVKTMMTTSVSKIRDGYNNLSSKYTSS
mgnify:FL=1